MLYFNKSNFIKNELPSIHQKLIDLGLKLILEHQNHLFYGQKEAFLITNDFIIFGQIQSDMETARFTLEQIAINCSNFDFEYFKTLDLPYSIVILNLNTNETYLCRDFFGIKPLFYAQTDGKILISNSIKTIKTIAKLEINDNEIFSYLDPNYDESKIRKETFFNDLFRVLPGDVIKISKDDCITIDQKTSDINFDAKEIINEDLKSLLTKNSNFVSQNQIIACHLSGGLDSSTLAGLFSKKHNLTGIYYNIGLKSTDESHYAKSAANKFKIQLIDTKSQNEDVLAKIKQICQITCQPETLIIPSFIFQEINQTANSIGAKLIISGHGGDSIMGNGFDFLEELFVAKKYTELKDSISKIKHLKSSLYHKNFWYYKLKTLSIQKKYLKILALIPTFGIPFTLIGNSILHKIKKFKLAKEPVLNISNSIYSLGSSTEIFNKNLSSKQNQHIAGNFLTLSNNALEVSDAIAQNAGIETYYPFLSKKILQFVLNTDSATNFNDGKGRGILRNTFADTLPENITNRLDKTSFLEFTHLVFKELWLTYGQFIDSDHKVWNYVKREIYLKEIKGFFQNKLENNSLNNKINLWCRVLYLSIWLDQESNG